MINIDNIFDINSADGFNECSMAIFRHQVKNCSVYKQYVELLGINPDNIISPEQIPMLPIRFFKSKKIITLPYNTAQQEQNLAEETIFTSSATTGMIPSKHYIIDLKIYEKSFTEGFRLFYGNPEEYAILSLLPSYLERKGSSLVYMAEKLIESASDGGFYLYDHNKLYEKLRELQQSGKKTILLGVAFALLDFVQNYKIDFPELIVMETGGMKGRGKEIERTELHKILCNGFGVKSIHSEYGMAELLSQAYSKGSGIFETPQWMKIIISDIYDPFQRYFGKHGCSHNNNPQDGQEGRINIIDLANINSCSFIETEDKGRLFANDSFTIDGRLKDAELRGCNMLIE